MFSSRSVYVLEPLHLGYPWLRLESARTTRDYGPSLPSSARASLTIWLDGFSKQEFGC